MTAKILDQLESDLSDLDISHPLDHSDLEGAMKDLLLEKEWMVEQEKETKAPNFIWDMGLEEKQEMELNLDCSSNDPDYQELEESFMSGKERGVERKKGIVDSGLKGSHNEKQKVSKTIFIKCLI